MSTDDQKLSAVFHGEALKAARDEVPQDLLDRLAEAADGNDEVRVRTAGEIAGYWMANPAGHQGHELVAAGLLILAGSTDRGLVADAMRVGYERRKGSLQGYDPTDATG